MNRPSFCRGLFALGLFLLGAMPVTAGAAHAAAVDGSGSEDRIGNWTVGGLASYTAVQGPAENTLAGLNSKIRIGSSLVPQIERYAAVRPWIGPGAQTPGAAGFAGAAGGSGGVAGGILVDVPLGSFVFTPSFGAGTLPRTPRDGGATTEFRSQLELGYEFDNKSRFSLGYSRIATDGNPADSASAPNNVFGFYYRLPFGGP